jgi:hypothetical protein
MPRLAELNINLLPSKKRVRISIYWVSVPAFLAFMSALIIYLVIAQNRALGSQEVENMRLKAALESCENEMTAYQPVQALEKEMTIKSEEVETIEKTKVSYAEVMNELDKIKPAEIIIVGAEIKPPRVIVNGFSPDHSNVSRMVEGIKASPIFTNVVLLSSEMNENTNEVKYTLEIEWEAAQK